MSSEQLQLVCLPVLCVSVCYCICLLQFLLKTTDNLVVIYKSQVELNFETNLHKFDQFRPCTNTRGMHSVESCFFLLCVNDANGKVLIMELYTHRI